MVVGVVINVGIVGEIVVGKSVVARVMVSRNVMKGVVDGMVVMGEGGAGGVNKGGGVVLDGKSISYAVRPKYVNASVMTRHA